MSTRGGAGEKVGTDRGKYLLNFCFKVKLGGEPRFTLVAASEPIFFHSHEVYVSWQIGFNRWPAASRRKRWPFSATSAPAPACRSTSCCKRQFESSAKSCKQQANHRSNPHQYPLRNSHHFVIPPQTPHDFSAHVPSPHTLKFRSNSIEKCHSDKAAQAQPNAARADKLPRAKSIF